MIKDFRAWDGEEYWYADENLLFHGKGTGKYLHEAEFKRENLEQFTGLVDFNRCKIYENDILINSMGEHSKYFQVIWSPEECGWRKVPKDQEHPITKIDPAFMEVIGTIRSF